MEMFRLQIHKQIFAENKFTVWSSIHLCNFLPKIMTSNLIVNPVIHVITNLPLADFLLKLLSKKLFRSHRFFENNCWVSGLGEIVNVGIKKQNTL